MTTGISIHALVKRATTILHSDYFDTAISIHALVKRATTKYALRDCKIFYFNPRPREEGDTVCNGNIFVCSDFNPRPREEGD